MKNRKKYPKSCGNCVYRYSLFYPEHCFFRTTRVKENICDKYEEKIPLDDLVADTEVEECKGNIEEEHLKQAIDNLIDELEFAVMQYPEQRDYLIKRTLEYIENEFKEEEK